MKRYDLIDSHCGAAMETCDDGDWVLHDDALAAIEQARRREREDIVRWLRPDDPFFCIGDLAKAADAIERKEHKVKI